MKFYTLAFLLSAISSLAFGYHESIPYCNFKAIITTKGGKVAKGYFVCTRMSVGKNDAGVYYVSGENEMIRKPIYENGGLLIDKAERRFFNEVKQHLQDTLEVFGDAILFRGNTEPGNIIMPWLIGTPSKIPINQVLTITVQVVYVFYAGVSLLTKLRTNDKTWITDQPLLCPRVAGDDYCSYDAIYFIGDKQSVLKNLTKLKTMLIERQTKYNNQLNAEAEALSNAIAKEVERLRSLRIIINGYCSC